MAEPSVAIPLPPPAKRRRNRLTLFLSDDTLASLQRVAEERGEHPGRLAAVIVEAATGTSSEPAP